MLILILCVTILFFILIAVSSTMSLLLLVISSHMVIASSTMSIILGCHSLGYISTGFITGYLFETFSPLWVLHLTLIASSTQLIFCMLSHLTLRVSKRENASVAKYVDDQDASRSLRSQ